MLLFAGLASGCGDSSPGSAPDAGPAADAAEQPVPSPVADPAAPALGPCPEGWTATESHGLEVCEPWAAGAAPTCPAGEAAFPSEGGCAPVGDPCPAGDWAEDLPADAFVLYVHPEATEGSGSREDPMSLEAASTWSGPTLVFALAKGTYEVDRLPILDGVTWWGACAAETVIRTPSAPAGTAPESRSTLVVLGDGVALRNIQLRPQSAIGIIASADVGAPPGLTLELTNVVIDGATAFALLLDRAVLTARSLVIRGLQGPGLPGARAIDASDSTVVLERVSFTDNAGGAIGASGAGADVAIQDALLGGSYSYHSNQTASGFTVLDGARVTATDVVVEDTEGVGALVLREGSRLALHQAIVRRTRPPAGTGLNGNGIEAAYGTEIALDRVRFDDNRTVGILVGEGTTLTANDLVLRGTSAPEGGSHGVGLAVQNATATLDRAVLDDNQEMGAFVSGVGTTAAFADTVIRGTRSTIEHGHLGRGLQVQLSARLDGQRLWLEGNREVGAYATAGGLIVLEDVTVAGTLERGCSTGECVGFGLGTGVIAGPEGSVELERFRIQRNVLIGLQVLSGGTAAIRDGEISDQPIGVNLQDPDFDLRTIAERVRYVRNERNLDRETQPAPETSVAGLD